MLFVIETNLPKYAWRSNRGIYFVESNSKESAINAINESNILTSNRIIPEEITNVWEKETFLSFHNHEKLSEPIIDDKGLKINDCTIIKCIEAGIE